MSEDQIKAWKVEIEKYKEVYAGLYPGLKPSDKLIASFCNIRGIPWPLPVVEDDLPDFLR